MNISISSPLIESTYIELPDKLKNPVKGLIKIKNNDNKCFLWCHTRHLNLVKRHPERITKVDERIILIIPVARKDYCRIERRICINVFCYENGLTYPVYVSDQKFGHSMDFLLIADENKSHCVYIKDFNRFMCNKKIMKIKNVFRNVVHSVLVMKKF